MWSKKELIDKQARFWVLMAKGSTLSSDWTDHRTGHARDRPSSSWLRQRALMFGEGPRLVG
jgi:hypothetical protein